MTSPSLLPVRMLTPPEQAAGLRIFWKSGWISLLTGCLLSTVAPIARAANTVDPADCSTKQVSVERLYVTYGILERSVPVQELKTYVKDGTMGENVSVYARYAGPEGLKQVRSVLQARADLRHEVIANFLYSPQGVELLKRVGQVIKPESRQSDYRFIRGAVIEAASDPEGLTVFNFLCHFRSRGLRVDVQRGLNIVGTLENLITQTKKASAAIVQQAERERTLNNPATDGKVDLNAAGPFTAEKQTVTLVDSSRKGLSALASRRVQVDVYLPGRKRQAVPNRLPVIVISHGLASDRTTFTYLAQHLASHGFAVLVPEHPGSNAKQLEALIRGTANEVSEPSEFVNRPLDITFLLNEIERQANGVAALNGRLNLQQVGVIGQSFGGYTALALGGASINVKELQQDCRDLDNTLNLSLLLQCRAEKLPLAEVPGLRDTRVKAVIALNPITSAIFGQTGISQIQVPTMIITGNADTIAPALWEQIQPFTWLTIPDRYLVMMDGGTHFSALTGIDRGVLPLPAEVVGPNPTIARRYVNALSLAFFKTYVAKQTKYRSYLSAAYASRISAPSLSLSLVRSLTPEQLANDAPTNIQQSQRSSPPSNSTR